LDWPLSGCWPWSLSPTYRSAFPTLWPHRVVVALSLLAVIALLNLCGLRESGDSHSLVPLFAVGAFLAFTLSQAGMVVHWWREQGRGWWLKATLNGLGALATGTALVVVGVSKFVQGAWITVF
jgi:amino acid transporter